MNQPLPIEEIFIVRAEELLRALGPTPTKAPSAEETERRYNAWLGRKLRTAQWADRPDGHGQTLVFTSSRAHGWSPRAAWQAISGLFSRLSARLFRRPDPRS